nr:retrovirus-related pol polyprotein from type-2 retrotransposable element r2dm [Quercus suber]
MIEGGNDEVAARVLTIAWALWQNKNATRLGEGRKSTKSWAQTLTDGATFSNFGAAGIGVIVHDAYGQVVTTLSNKLMAHFGEIETEVKALEAGMEFARDVGIQEFILESDSSVLIRSLLGLSSPPSSVASVVQAFVPGRRTSDNIILVQEIIKTLTHKRGGQGYVALKLDLDKAYDLLEWPFIKDSLEFFQVSPNLIMLIMNMISSTCYQIQWNGAPLLEVIPSRAACQDDPLSPYLFIMCLKRLSLMSEEAIWDKLIHPIGFRGQV